MSVNILNNVDFKVKKYPVEYTFKGKTRIDPERFVNVREDTGERMGIVSATYENFDHRQNIEIVANVVKQLSPKFSVENIVDGGKIWSTFSLEDYIFMENVKNEAVMLQIRILNSHDASSQYRAFLDATRLVCMNGMMASETLSSLSLMHTKGNNPDLVASRIETEIQSITTGYEKLYNKLSSTKRLPEEDKTVDLKKNSFLKLPENIRKEAFEKYSEELKNVNGNDSAWVQYNQYTNAITRNDVQINTKMIHMNTLMNVFTNQIAI